MIGALGYLVWRTTRNRIVRQLGRLKSPRYALALIVSMAFLWLVFLAPMDQTQTVATPGSTDGTRLAVTFGTLGALYFLLSWIWSWWREKSSLALAFQPPEVHTLFSAPLSRRVLLAYKLARSQLFVLFNAIIWMALLRRWGVTLGPPFRFATAWELFTLFSLHRFAVALVRVVPFTPGRRVLLYVARAVSIAGAGALLAGVVPTLLQTSSIPARDLFPALGDALHRAPATYALEPFRLILAPLFAPNVQEWWPAFWIVAALSAAHAALVFGMDVEYEETAAAASAELARRFAALKRGDLRVPDKTAPGKVPRQWLPLAPLGHPAIAIVWKNTLAWVRYGGLRSGAFLIGMAATMTIVLSMLPAGSREDGRALAALSLMPLFMVFGMSVVIGPRTLRNDLRQDLTSLPLLKTYPLPSAHIMLAEMASPAMALTVFQMTLLLTAMAMMPPILRDGLRVVPVTLLLVLAPAVLGALNAASLAIQNATVMLFPGWVRLGPGDAGLEAIGQNVLVTIGQLLVLAVGLVPAVAVATVVFLALGALGREVALAAAALTGSAILLAGVVLMALALGSAFERTEPSAVV